jgi:hypothetical protein
MVDEGERTAMAVLVGGTNSRAVTVGEVEVEVEVATGCWWRVDVLLRMGE